jgi:hypothetical protein
VPENTSPIVSLKCVWAPFHQRLAPTLRLSELHSVNPIWSRCVFDNRLSMPEFQAASLWAHWNQLVGLPDLYVQGYSSRLIDLVPLLVRKTMKLAVVQQLSHLISIPICFWRYLFSIYHRFIDFVSELDTLCWFWWLGNGTWTDETAVIRSKSFWATKAMARAFKWEQRNTWSSWSN